MSPETPESASRNEQIQKKQHDLDAADGKIDARVSQGTPEEQQKLTETYIGKLNLLQGHLRELRKTVDIQRNARATHWQELAQTCSDIEMQLLTTLSSIDAKNARDRVDAFNGEIDQFLNRVEGAESAHRPERTREAQESQHVNTLLLRRKALEDVLTNLRREYNNACTAERNDLKGLERYVREEDEEAQERLLKIIEWHRQHKQDIQTKMQSPAREIIALDIAITRLRERDARSAGRVDDADRALLKLLEEYGGDLEKLDPRTYSDARNAEHALAERDALTDFERNLFAEGREEEALSQALTALREAQNITDILDQVQARQTFVIERMTKGSEYWKNGVPLREERKQDHMKHYYVATIDFRGGKKLTVVLTPAAKTALERIPRDAQPILLKPIQSLQTKTTRGGRYSRTEFTIPASDYTLDSHHIGYVKDSEVYQSGSAKVDLATHEHRQDIEKQLRNQRGFSVASTPFVRHIASHQELCCPIL